MLVTPTSADLGGEVASDFGEAIQPDEPRGEVTIAAEAFTVRGMEAPVAPTPRTSAVRGGGVRSVLVLCHHPARPAVQMAQRDPVPRRAERRGVDTSRAPAGGRRSVRRQRLDTPRSWVRQPRCRLLRRR